MHLQENSVLNINTREEEGGTGEEEFDNIEIQRDTELFIRDNAFEDAQVKVNEEEDKVTVKLFDNNVEQDRTQVGREGTVVEINVNVLRTQTDLIEAMKRNLDPNSRIKFVSKPSTEDLDYLDFDNDYVVITLENDFDDGSILRASSQLRRPPSRRRRPQARRRPRGKRIFLQG